MNSILKFKINKKKSAFFINKKLVNFIQKFSSKNDQIQILTKKIIDNIDIFKRNNRKKNKSNIIFKI